VQPIPFVEYGQDETNSGAMTDFPGLLAAEEQEAGLKWEYHLRIQNGVDVCQEKRRTRRQNSLTFL